MRRLVAQSYLVLFLLMIFVVPVNAYQFEHLGMEDGLSNGYVTSIAQDDRGQIWVATVMGLNRFDGHTFTSFNTDNSNIPENYILNICPDKTGRLWMCTEKGLLCYYDNKTMKIVIPKWQFGLGGKPSFIKISPASDGGLWFLRTSDSPVHYDLRTGAFKSLSIENKKVFKGFKQSILDDGKGHLWIGYGKLGGLCVVNIKSGRVLRYRHNKLEAGSLPGDNVYTIFKDKSGNIWLGTNHGLALFLSGSQRFMTYIHHETMPFSIMSDHIFSISQSADGKLWIGSDIGGVSVLDMRNGVWRNPQKAIFNNITAGIGNKCLSSRNIHRLFIDNFGNTWVGNFGTGLDVIRHQMSPFDYLGTQGNRSGAQMKGDIWSLCRDANNNVWVGGENVISMFSFDRLKQTIDLSNYLSRSFAQVRTLLDDGEGNLWIGLYDDGLLKMNLPTHKISRMGMPKSNLDVNCISKDRRGVIWIGHEYGIISYRQGRQNKEIYINKILGNTAVFGIQCDKTDRLWVATLQNGIYIFDKNGTILEHKTAGRGLSDNKIFNLSQDRYGRMWACTDKGLDCFRNLHRIHVYNLRNSLSSNHVYGIQEDMNGVMWVSTADGISSVDIRKGKVVNYDRRYGIPQSSYVDGNVKSCITSDGKIYFGLRDAVVSFNPDIVLGVKNNISPFFITDCRIMNLKDGEYSIIPNMEIGDSPVIKLDYNENTIKISFNISDFSQKNGVEYAYKMEGLGDLWTNIHNENSVVFRNLRFGEYTLYVRARLNGQSWNNVRMASVRIIVSPPWWYAWYSWLLYVVVVIFVVYFVFKFYLKKVRLEDSLQKEIDENRIRQQLHEEKMNFYTNIAHELRTPLTLILGPLEDIKDDSEFGGKLQRKIKLIYNSALRLSTLINQLMEFRKSETHNRQITVRRGNLSRLVTDVVSHYSDMNNNENVNVILKIEDDYAVCLFDPEVVTIILDNLISNALKYTPYGTISIKLTDVYDADHREMYEITVEDTGYGIQKDALPLIFDRYYQVGGKHQVSGSGIGLSLVKSLVTLHEGVITVDSEPGKGTIFHFSLYKENQYINALHDDAIVKEDVVMCQDHIPDKDTNTKPILAIVEDNTDIRNYIKESLQDDFIIIEAPDGEKGWDIIENNVPDIIISDIMMPLMNGVELCRKIKRNVYTSHIPVILLTAKDTIADKEEGYESGADSYLTKPFSAKLLKVRVRNIMEQRLLIMRKYIESAVNDRHDADNGESFSASIQQTNLGINKLDSEFITKLTSVIKENLASDKLKVDFLADKMCMSHSAFYRKVKSMTGKSANEYIRKVRLHRAMELLERTSNNVTEAAYMTGFGDLAYFRACFKSEFGINPSEVVKQK